MSIHDRLRDLERRVLDDCPECGGDGETRIRLLKINPDGSKPPLPGPCGTCGREPRVIRLRPIRLDGPRAVTIDQ